MKKTSEKIKIIVASVLLIVCLFVCFFGFDFFTPKQNYSDLSLGWNLVLVNFENYIPLGYEVNLKEVSDGVFVDSRIYPKLTEMIEAAKKDSVYMVVVSGYRSEKKQKQLMKDKIIEYLRGGQNYFKAKKNAEKWVAKEGTSEHQLGLAVDINQNSALCNADKVYDWLLCNAHNYGFIKRYPSDKTEITGIINEPWHYRYVGVGAAKEMKEKNLCLEEYVSFLENNEYD